MHEVFRDGVCLNTTTLDEVKALAIDGHVDVRCRRGALRVGARSGPSDSTL